MDELCLPIIFESSPVLLNRPPLYTKLVEVAMISHYIAWGLYTSSLFLSFIWNEEVITYVTYWIAVASFCTVYLISFCYCEIQIYFHSYPKGGGMELILF